MGQVVDEIDWWKVDILFIDQSIPIITPLNLSFFIRSCVVYEKFFYDKITNLLKDSNKLGIY